MATQNYVDGVTLSAAAEWNKWDTAAYSVLASVAGTNTITATGAANYTYAAATPPVVFIPANTNSGATTINVTPSGSTALGAKNVFCNGAACVGGELRSGVPVSVIYDGTQFNIIGPFAGGNLPNGQIKFPAAQNASADVNTLDDYEEGTWTPVVGGTATYTTQLGTYTKIGRLVTIQGYLTINSIGSGSTNTISGLPFTAATGGATYTTGAVVWISAASNFVAVTALVQANTTTVQLFGLGAAGTSMVLAGVLANSTSVGFTVSYIV